MTNNKDCKPKITVTKMTEEEFRERCPDAIVINTEEDVKKLAKKLGVDYEEIKKQQ
jgi:hypothetical protein